MAQILDQPRTLNETEKKHYRVAISTGYDLTGQFTEDHNSVILEFASEREYKQYSARMMGPHGREQIHFKTNS